MMKNRSEERRDDELRALKITPSWSRHAEGSCLIEIGATKVLCTASVENNVPPWLRDTGKGWVTAEYGMLPRSTHSRKPRDGSRGKPDGRGVEIQRLIGRSLRAVVDLKILGERQITLDCDVLQADGGTRCAAITGAWVALYEAVISLRRKGVLDASPLLDHVAAVSVGMVAGRGVLDLDYSEDAGAEVDMNVVMSGSGRLIEVQATGESRAFSRAELDAMLDLAASGIASLVELQKTAAEYST